VPIPPRKKLPHEIPFGIDPAQYTAGLVTNAEDWPYVFVAHFQPR
jgi:hypothetical protein